MKNWHPCVWCYLAGAVSMLIVGILIGLLDQAGYLDVVFDGLRVPK